MRIEQNEEEKGIEIDNFANFLTDIPKSCPSRANIYTNGTFCLNPKLRDRPQRMPTHPKLGVIGIRKRKTLPFSPSLLLSLKLFFFHSYSHKKSFLCLLNVCINVCIKSMCIFFFINLILFSVYELGSFGILSVFLHNICGGE